MNNSEFENKLLLAGLDKLIFSNLTNTPIRTISNWFTSRKGKIAKTPKWVEPYLDLYIKNRKNEIYIEKLHEELIKDIRKNAKD